MSSIEDHIGESDHLERLAGIVSGFLVGSGVSLSSIYHPEHIPVLCSFISLGIVGIYAGARDRMDFSSEDAAHGLRDFLTSMFVSGALVTSTNYLVS